MLVPRPKGPADEPMAQAQPKLKEMSDAQRLSVDSSGSASQCRWSRRLRAVTLVVVLTRCGCGIAGHVVNPTRC